MQISISLLYSFNPFFNETNYSIANLLILSNITNKYPIKLQKIGLNRTIEPYNYSFKYYLQTEQQFQTAIHTAEAHESHCQQTGSYQCDRHALHTLWNVNHSQLLTDTCKQDHS